MTEQKKKKKVHEGPCGGIEVEPETEDDYRKINNLLRKRNVEFHTLNLRSKKPLKVVLKGVPHEVIMVEVKEVLQAKN